MVEFVIRVNQQRTAYIPKEIVENLGYEWTLVPNARVAVIYPRRCSLETAIRSLQLILDGLRVRLSAEREVRSSTEHSVNSTAEKLRQSVEDAFNTPISSKYLSKIDN